MTATDRFRSGAITVVGVLLVVQSIVGADSPRWELLFVGLGLLGVNVGDLLVLAGRRTAPPEPAHPSTGESPPEAPPDVPET